MRNYCASLCRSVIGLLLCLVLLGMAGVAPAAAAPATPGLVPAQISDAASLPMNAPMVEQVEHTPAAMSPFTDVSTSHVFYEHISWLAEKGVSTGWAQKDGTAVFRPAAPVLREQMAAFLYRSAGSPGYTPPAVSPFTDVSTQHTFYKEIAWLAHSGISTGWVRGDGTALYKPGTLVLREQMAAFLYRLAGEPAYEAPTASPFADLNTGQGFYKEMAWLADNEISTGWILDENTAVYRPGNQILRDQMAAFLYRINALLPEQNPGEEPDTELAITQDPLIEGIVGLDYLQQLQATGGNGGLDWAATGLPEGIVLAGDGLLSGQPVRLGEHQVSVRATDATGATATAVLALDVTRQMPAECLDQACSEVIPSARTVEVPANNIAGLTRDATTETVNSVTITGLEISAGQVLVLTPVPEAESGVIVHVDAVTPGPDGSHTATVTPTTVADAYTEGIIHATDETVGAQMAAAAAAAEATSEEPTGPPLPEELTTPEDPLVGASAVVVTQPRLECEAGVIAQVHALSVTPKLTPKVTAIWKRPILGGKGIYVGTGGLDVYQFDLDGDLEMMVGAEMSGKGECVLHGPKVKAFIPAGPTGAMVFTTQPSMTFNVSGKVEISTTATLTCGSSYRWTPEHGGDDTAYCKTSDRDMGITSDTGIDANLIGKIDSRVAWNDMAGIEGNIQTGLHATYRPAETPVAELRGTVALYLGACLACFWGNTPARLPLYTDTIFDRTLHTWGQAPPPAGLPTDPSAPLSITTSALPSGTIGEPYRTALTATGGTPPYTWSITSGALPPGMTLSPAGEITGTPTTTGNSQFTISVTDSSRSSENVSTAIHIELSTSAELQNVEKIIGNRESTYALKTDGTIWAWGWNYFGQLGNGTTTDSSVPVQVSGLTNVHSIKVGGLSAYALSTDGTVWAWGHNNDGQLGNGTTTSSPVPVQISGLPDIQNLQSNGGTMYALSTDGTVWAWGRNYYGQLGNGTTTDSITPIQVTGLTNVRSLESGGNSTYALTTDGTVWAWGNNDYGQLGNGTTIGSSVPVQVSELTNVRSLESGGNSTYALSTDGTVWAWGHNDVGQLGNGTTVGSAVPVQVTGLTNVRNLEANGRTVYALTTDGNVWAWGENFPGELGDNTLMDSTVPVQVSGLTNIKSLETDSSSTYALTTDGTAVNVD